MKEKAPSHRRTTFSFFSLLNQSRVDNICKYQWGERCERNEALGRKKNHLIEKTKYQSAIRNTRKWEIRKRSLTSKVVRSWNSCQWRGLGHKKPIWGSSGTWKIEERITSCYGFQTFSVSSSWTFEIQILFLALSLT